MSEAKFSSVFGRIYDAVVFGAGYAGFAAALCLRKKGRRVLLVERDAGLVWESGRAFFPHAGEAEDPLWREWYQRLKNKNACCQGMVQGAAAEVEATLLLIEAGIEVLYYAAAVGVEMAGKMLAAVIVGSKGGGLRRLIARQWLDTTEDGGLLRLVRPLGAVPAPRRQSAFIFLRHADWPKTEDEDFTLPAADAINTLRWRAAPWSGERYLEVETEGDIPLFRAIPAALHALRDHRSSACQEAVVSHCSILPLRAYAPAQRRRIAMPANMVAACPWLGHAPSMTLAERFAAGAAAARLLLEAERCEAGKRLQNRDIDSLSIAAAAAEAEVGVAGLGTGGALAAMAAARQGCRTAAFDLMPFAGGIGSGGGIPIYYYGMAGGLQAEVDRRVNELDALFAPAEQMPSQWHSDAKKCALASMLAEAGVTIFWRSLLCAVESDRRRIKTALLATPCGPLRISAEAWLDATGDGDLATAGGCRFSLGRYGDGRIHAYTQSCGQVGCKEGKARLQVVNFDSGFVDPTDAEDLTRARLVGVCQHRRGDYSVEDRPTYIAPLVGLRQSRHIIANTTLTLADLIERRTFSDSVGYIGSHYDNHSRDYEFESDEGMFWVWACGAWSVKIGCEIPYGVLVPQDCDNLWLASRCLGVTHDSHACFRMMRDLQRIGEIAGLAAALAVRQKTTNREVSIAALRLCLSATGSLDPGHDGKDGYGLLAGIETLESGRKFRGDCRAEDATRWLAVLADEKADFLPTGDREARWVSHAMWLLYRHPHLCRSEIQRLIHDRRSAISWRAAAVAAMWGEAIAEPRLCHAIKTAEDGREEFGDTGRTASWHKAVPNWITAIALLRLCGTGLCFSVLAAVAEKPDTPLNVRTAVAITIGRIARRGLPAAERRKAAAILKQLAALPLPHPADRAPVYHLPLPPRSSAPPRCHVREDAIWQLHLVIAQARRALGLPIAKNARGFSVDSRAIVRQAFADLIRG